MKWSENTTYSFVLEYLKHECLFNAKCISYRNKLARDAAIMKICETMDITDFGPKEALSKIKSIRSTYSQELKKINESTKSGASADDVYVPTLKWFTMYHGVMKNKNLTPKETQSNLDSNDTEEIERITSQEVPITQEAEAAKKPVYTRKRNIKCLESLVNKVRAVGEMVQASTTNNENEFDIFGRSVAAQLNAMPLILALQAQSHIQNYLTSIRMHAIAQPSNLQVYSPTPPSTTYISSPTPTTNSSFPGVSFDNNSTENLQPNSPPPAAAASPTALYTHSPMVMNSSVSEQGDILEFAIQSIINE